MCKPSCCSGKSGSSLGVLAVITAAVFIAMIAVPAIHTAELILRTAIKIAIISLTITAALAGTAAVVMIATRIPRGRRGIATLRTNRVLETIHHAADTSVGHSPSRSDLRPVPRPADLTSVLRDSPHLRSADAGDIENAALNPERRWQ